MKLDEINLKILNLKRLRKELYGVPLRDDSSSLNTLKYSKQLFQRVLENSLLQEKPFYIVCNVKNVPGILFPLIRLEVDYIPLIGANFPGLYRGYEEIVLSEARNFLANFSIPIVSYKFYMC